jgi:hypothetical protein
MNCIRRSVWYGFLYSLHQHKPRDSTFDRTKIAFSADMFLSYQQNTTLTQTIHPMTHESKYISYQADRD